MSVIDDVGNSSVSIFLNSDQQHTGTIDQKRSKGLDGTYLELNRLQVPRGTYPAVQQNAAVTKDAGRKVP